MSRLCVRLGDFLLSLFLERRPLDADPQALAAFLLTAIHGLRVVGKANPDPALLTSAIDSALVVLPRPTAAAAEGP